MLMIHIHKNEYQTYETFLYIRAYIHTYIQGFLGGSDGKESACSAGDPGCIPGSGRSPGEGNSNPSNILAWRIPWTEVQFMGSQWVRHDWETNTFTFIYIHTHTHIYIQFRFEYLSIVSCRWVWRKIFLPSFYQSTTNYPILKNFFSHLEFLKLKVTMKKGMNLIFSIAKSHSGTSKYQKFK